MADGSYESKRSPSFSRLMRVGVKSSIRVLTYPMYMGDVKKRIGFVLTLKNKSEMPYLVLRFLKSAKFI
jgi:hypothetical protein